MTPAETYVRSKHPGAWCSWKDYLAKIYADRVTFAALSATFANEHDAWEDAEKKVREKTQ
jgi:hypothetical protein